MKGHTYCYYISVSYSTWDRNTRSMFCYFAYLTCLLVRIWNRLLCNIHDACWQEYGRADVLLVLLDGLSWLRPPPPVASCRQQPNKHNRPSFPSNTTWVTTLQRLRHQWQGQQRQNNKIAPSDPTTPGPKAPSTSDVGLKLMLGLSIPWARCALD